MFKVAVFSYFLALANAGTTTFTIPATPPKSCDVLDAAPVALSFEFFQFPSYFTNVSHTHSCTKQLERLTGTWPRIRIGGTSQDRATYDPSLPAYVLYPGSENTFSGPSNFTFGPSFIELANEYPGTVVMGLNRGANEINNTIEAAKAVQKGMKNLYAIELGNEPDIYPYVNFPIATNPLTWTPAAEALSESTWQLAIGGALHTTHLIQAGNFETINFNASELIADENPQALKYIKDFSHHNYPQSTYFTVSLPALMSHANIAANVAQYASDVRAAQGEGWEYVFGETNSVSGGGSNLTSPTFGSALWVLDYALKAASINIKRSYFHHCTIGICYYSFWDRININAPFYGAYVAAAAMAGGRYIVALDEGARNYGGYAVYDGEGRGMRMVLLNSDYYAGNGTRTQEKFVVDGLGEGRVRVRRFTAESALARVDEGQVPRFGGLWFRNGDCTLVGEAEFEEAQVVKGVAELSVAASEALLVELC